MSGNTAISPNGELVTLMEGPVYLQSYNSYIKVIGPGRIQVVSVDPEIMGVLSCYNTGECHYYTMIKNGTTDQQGYRIISEQEYDLAYAIASDHCELLHNSCKNG